MDSATAERFAALQDDLGRALSANLPGGNTDHVLIALCSHSVAESLIAHYGPRVRAMEHRYLVAYLMLHRISHCELVYVCTQQPDQSIIEYYDSLVVGTSGGSAIDRFRVVVVDDGTMRSVSAKLLDQPDVLERLRADLRGRPAYIQPWNVTDLEVEVALQLGLPLNGTSPSSGRSATRAPGAD